MALFWGTAHFVIVDALELTPTEIDLGEIGIKKGAAKFSFSVRLEDPSGTCDIDSGCGCISVEEDTGNSNPLLQGDKSFSGEIQFGASKGQAEKRIEVKAVENGISTSKILLIKYHALPVFDVLPGKIMRWVLPSGEEKRADLIFAPDVHIKKISIVQKPEDFVASVKKKDASGVSWELCVAPRRKKPTPMPIPESLRLSIESDSPRISDLVFFLMIDEQSALKQQGR
jgi:hypothetical protein